MNIAANASHTTRGGRGRAAGRAVWHLAQRTIGAAGGALVGALATVAFGIIPGPVLDLAQQASEFIR